MTVAIRAPQRRWVLGVQSLAFIAAIWMGFCQNFLAILATRWSFSIARGILVAKDIYLCLFALALCLTFIVRARLPNKTIGLCVAAALFVVTAGLISSSFNLLSLRQLLIVPLYFLYGSWFVRKATVTRIERLLLVSFAVIAMTGFVERFLLFDSTEFFWRTAGIERYLEIKGFAQWAYGVGGVPGNFYSYDLIGLGVDPIRRMTSLLAEPTLLGQLLIFPTLYYLIARKPLAVLIYGATLLLTLSKGGVVGLIAGFVWFYCTEKKGVMVKALLIVVLFAVLGAFWYLVLIGSAASMLAHFGGLLSNFSALMQHPLGGGIGSAGNFAVLASGTDDIGAGESYLGTLVGQLGFIGLALYAWMTYTIHRIEAPHNNIFLVTVKYASLATLVTGIASESAISYVGTGFIFALLPFLITESRKVSVQHATALCVAA